MLIATRTSLSDDEAMARPRPMIAGMIASAGAMHVPGPEPEKRLGIALAHLLGVATVRYVSTVPPVSQMPLEEVIARTIPAIQIHFTPR